MSSLLRRRAASWRARAVPLLLPILTIAVAALLFGPLAIYLGERVFLRVTASHAPTMPLLQCFEAGAIQGGAVGLVCLLVLRAGGRVRTGVGLCAGLMLLLATALTLADWWGCRGLPSPAATAELAAWGLLISTAVAAITALLTAVMASVLAGALGQRA